MCQFLRFLMLEFQLQSLLDYSYFVPTTVTNVISTMDGNYNIAWRLDRRSHPAVTLPKNFALH